MIKLCPHCKLSVWNDWRWQLSQRLNTVEDFVQVIRLTPEEVEGLAAPGLFRVDVTPYFASLKIRVLLNTEGER